MNSLAKVMHDRYCKTCWHLPAQSYVAKSHNLAKVMHGRYCKTGCGFYAAKVVEKEAITLLKLCMADNARHVGIFVRNHDRITLN